MISTLIFGAVICVLIMLYFIICRVIVKYNLTESNIRSTCIITTLVLARVIITLCIFYIILTIKYLII